MVSEVQPIAVHLYWKNILSAHGLAKLGSLGPRLA